MNVVDSAILAASPMSRLARRRRSARSARRSLKCCGRRSKRRRRVGSSSCSARTAAPSRQRLMRESMSRGMGANVRRAAHWRNCSFRMRLPAQIGPTHDPPPESDPDPGAAKRQLRVGLNVWGRERPSSSAIVSSAESASVAQRDRYRAGIGVSRPSSWRSARPRMSLAAAGNAIIIEQSAEQDDAVRMNPARVRASPRRPSRDRLHPAARS